MGQTRVQRHTKPNQEGPQALVEHTQRCASLLLRYIALNMSMSMYSGVGTYRTIHCTTAPTATMPSCAIMSGG